jgi:hypothetical protein
MDRAGLESRSEDLHPIDIVETLAEHHSWEFDRLGDDQIAMAVEGSWRTYSLSLAWSAADETLRLVCSFDMDPPEAALPRLYEALDLSNDRIWCGAFTLWRAQKMMVLRYGLNLAGEAQASAAQIDDMVCAAIVACERFYPAFQLVAWGGEAPAKALNIAMAESYGRA